MGPNLTLKKVIQGIYQGTLFSSQQATHCVMALPNVIWPWSIFYSKDQLFRKENEESLGVFYFWNWIFKINWLFGRHVPNLPRYYNIWNVWNLKFWKLKCLNSNVWILKVEIWNLYVKCLDFKILKTKMFELGCVNI
jgi:hypothetical protein